jgi:Tfp pilus assembly protein PilZ
MPHILIVAAHSEHAEIYRKAVKRAGTSCDVAHSIDDMHEKMCRTAYNGVLLDVFTTVKASPREKILIQEISDAYPSMRVRWDVRKRQVCGLVLGKTLDRDDPVGDFVDRFCRCHPARKCRGSKRYPLHFNVLLSRQRDSQNDLEKTVTLDISEGGCFLITSQAWQDGENVWLRFADLCDGTPVQAEVCRHQPWGESLCVPGIGVKFMQMPPTLLQLLRHRLTAD